MGFLVAESEPECIFGLPNIVLAPHFTVQSVYKLLKSRSRLSFILKENLEKLDFAVLVGVMRGTNFAARFPGRTEA